MVHLEGRILFTMTQSSSFSQMIHFPQIQTSWNIVNCEMPWTSEFNTKQQNKLQPLIAKTIQQVLHIVPLNQCEVLRILQNSCSTATLAIPSAQPRNIHNAPFHNSVHQTPHAANTSRRWQASTKCFLMGNQDLPSQPLPKTRCVFAVVAGCRARASAPQITAWWRWSASVSSRSRR